MNERAFEDELVAHPELLGEPLLILGRQLADFVEDAKRLDLLAIDADGEIVLVEVKVDEEFDFTDLQAIGYAGAYADRPTDFFAKILARSAADSETIRRNAGLGDQAGEDEARGAIVDFLSVEEFDDWNPSKQIRIKLVAPGFPKRVLNNVRWLGDVFGLPIEAIRAQLFEVSGDLQVHFERLLPLPGIEEFDLSIRQREQNIKRENRERRKPVFSLLVRNGVLRDGDKVQLDRSGLPSAHRHLYEPDHVAFEGVVDTDIPNRLRWRPSAEVEPRLVAPASLAYEACCALTGEPVQDFGTPVAEYFTHGSTGKTLEALALEAGLWESS